MMEPRTGHWRSAHEIAVFDPHLRVLSFSAQLRASSGCLGRPALLLAVISPLSLTPTFVDPPEQLIRFIRKCREGFDVVYAIRDCKRKENIVKRVKLAFCTTGCSKRLAALDIPLDAGDFCVMSLAGAARRPQRAAGTQSLCT